MLAKKANRKKEKSLTFEGVTFMLSPPLYFVTVQATLLPCLNVPVDNFQNMRLTPPVNTHLA